MTDTQQTNPRDLSPETLKIRQQNLNKSLIATEHLLNSKAPDDYDILAIQEPYIDFAGKSRARRQWYPIYPKTHYLDNSGRMRSMLLINKKIASETWAAIEVGSPDVTGVKISTTRKDILIFNLYCDQNNSSAIMKTDLFLQERGRTNQRDGKTTSIIWVGDFNRHHPMWDDPKNSHLFTRHNLDEAQVLIHAITEQNLYMALPKHIPTLKVMASKNYTRTDNVFVSIDMHNALITCDTKPYDQPPRTDHMPIDTTIDLELRRNTEKMRYDFRAINWDKFNETLANKIQNQVLSTTLTCSADLFDRIDLLNRIINETIEEEAPTTRPTSYTKRWWTKEISKLRQTMRSRNRAAYRNRTNLNHPAHQEYKEARNTYANAISKAKRDTWNAFLENLDEKSVWTVHKYTSSAPNDGGQARVPDLIYKTRSG